MHDRGEDAVYFLVFRTVACIGQIAENALLDGSLFEVAVIHHNPGTSTTWSPAWWRRSSPPAANYGAGPGVQAAGRVESQCVYLISSSRSEPPETSIARTAWPLPLA